MQARARSARRLLGFLILPMFNVVTPLITLPAITSRYGAAAWASIAVAQSIGSACAVVVELGWGLNGSQRVARQHPANQRRSFVLALLTRFLVSIPVIVVAAIVSFLISTDYRLVSAIVAVAIAIWAFDTAWYFIGTGRPAKIIVTDSIPRVAPVVLAAVLILHGAPLWFYAVALLVPAIACPFLGMISVGVRRHDFHGWTFRRVLRATAAQSTALAGRVFSAAYIALPVALVGIVYPQGIAVFAAAERLQRMTMSVLQAVPNALQGWVGKPGDAHERRRRGWLAVVANMAMGAVAGLGFALAAPLLARFVFSGVAPVPLELSSLCGVLIFVVCTSRATGGILLVALGRIRVIAMSALTGGLVGVPAILFFASLLGPRGGLVGELCAELAVIVVQLAGIRRATRSARQPLTWRGRQGGEP
jgi:O-antigen/teichoic acid export membrane protein